MNLTKEVKIYIVVGLAVIIGAFAFGRYSAPERVKTEIKTVTVEKVVYTQAHTKTTINEDKNGNKSTVIISDTNTQDSTHSTSTDSSKEVVSRGRLINVSLLVGSTVAMTTPRDELVSTKLLPIYGVNITAPVFGPITVSGWMLSNLIVGAGIGINF